MSRIPEATVRKILDQTDIAAVIGEYVRLEKKGGRYLGLCPFHNEKSPSFNVDREKGFFYCFGCQKGGDVIKFLTEHERMSFVEAVEHLAEKAGIPLEVEEGASEEERERAALRELYERLATSFHYFLAEHPSGKEARDILERRGIPAAIRDSFRLGYAPSDRAWLHRFLVKKGYSAAFLARSGLFSERHPEFPLYADRLMFPIMTPRGEVIAFGGRLLGGEGPKYINSPDTALFRKQENLFALDKAAPSIRKEGRVIVCEGYMDALSFHVAGETCAVAPLGTAFTERQAKLLRRYADLVYFAFDADAAGQKATEKALVIAAAAGLESRVVSLPGGKDASEILEKEGPESLQKNRDLAINGGDFLVRRARSLFDLSTVEGKSKAVASLFPYIDALDSEVRRDAFVDISAREFRLDPRSIRSDFSDFKKGVSPRKTETAAAQGARPKPRTPDFLLMMAVAIHSDLFERVRKAVTIDELDDSRARELYIALEEGFRAEEKGLESLVNRLMDEQLKNAVLAAAVSGEFDVNVERFADEGLGRIERRSTLLRRERICERISELGPDGEGLSELQYELMHLDAELARMKGERDERS